MIIYLFSYLCAHSIAKGNYNFNIIKEGNKTDTPYTFKPKKVF
jgi:hypothetical protein